MFVAQILTKDLIGETQPLSIQTLIEQIARTAMVAEATDQAAVDALRAQFSDLQDLCPDDADSALRRFADDAVKLLTVVTDGAPAGAGSAFDELLGQIAEIQSILNRSSQAGAEVAGSADADAAAASDVASPTAEDEWPSDATDAEIDLELLYAWISSCESGLIDLEATILKIDNEPACVDELTADAARCIHTLKGECGVLSLTTAQKVLHETETLIGARLEAGIGFPVDEVLVVVDWLRQFVEQLTENPSATPEGVGDVLARLAATATASSTDAAMEASEENDSASVQLEEDAPAAVEELSDDDAEAILAMLEAEHAAGAADDETERFVPDGDAPAVAAETAAAVSSAAIADDGSPVVFPSDLGMDENLNDFLCEAREHLENAEAALLSLETMPEDLDLIGAVFRAFHTIKGVAGFMNLVPIVDLAHVAETLLDRIREGELEFTTPRLNLVLRSCDHLEQLIGVLEGSAAPTVASQQTLIVELTAAAGGTTAHEDETTVAEATGSAASEAPAEPAADVKDDGSVEAVGVESSVCASEASTPAAPSESTPTSMPATTPAATPATTPASGSASGAAQPSQQLTEVKGTDDSSSSRRSTRMDQTVKVSTTRMDSLVTMVGELVIAHQMIAQDPSILSNHDQRLHRNMTQVGKIIRDLQEVSMSLRMVTLKGTFQKMARIVRDVASKSGKRITFVMEGEDVELDRNVVEEIADPLVHMVRNSCDHGIEPESDRLASGKSPEGYLTLRAYHQGGRIIIEVVDDGRGLNRERILSKALERGIVSSEREAAEMTDTDVWNLIFQPGFSTAEAVTDLSGRGVGMDVVRRNIEALRGSVAVESTPGSGSTMRISLPLTMAIIDGMVVRVGEQRYVLPTLSIEQSFQPRPGQVKTCQRDGEMVDIRGTMLPVFRLKEVFGIPEGADDVTDALLIVLESGGTRFCLMVDDILGQQQVVIKSLGNGMAPIRGVSGGAILGDGLVALILDMGGVLQEATGIAATV